MYTFLFLLVLLCAVAAVRELPARYTLSLSVVTLALAVLAFLPHVVGREFGIAL
ncbi:hypothetical protein [Nocardia sp. NPDC051832]|uniref:hypothetical protein n=1 Tax=Nocardia sp. NPDC051832 TaxID=3155673 RepID=UPI0034438078